MSLFRLSLRTKMTKINGGARRKNSLMLSSETPIANSGGERCREKSET